MRTLARRLTPALVLPLLLVGLSPSQAAEPGKARPSVAPTDVVPSPGEVVAALDGVDELVLDGAPGVVTGDAAHSKGGGVEVSVPRDAASAVAIASVSGGDNLEIGIPGGRENATSVVRDGVSIFTNATDGTAVAVNPLAAGGAQFIVTIGGPESPTSYEFPVVVPEGASLQLTADGGAEVAFPDGTLIASIPAPWAVDANQQPVATRFEVVGSTLVQVVDHSAADAYPVVADPSTFSCDWYTHFCVKYTKSETKFIASKVNTGLGIGGVICGFVGLAGGVPGLVCLSVLGLVGGPLADSFSNAAAKGKCVELHYLTSPWVLTHWKTEGC